MFRQLARLAEEHELLEALPFLRGNADDEDDLINELLYDDDEALEIVARMKKEKMVKNLKYKL